MQEYDPLILRDQIVGQIEHARAHDVTRSPLVRLEVLIEYLESVVEDINLYDTHYHCPDCGADLEFCHQIAGDDHVIGYCSEHGEVTALLAEHP